MPSTHRSSKVAILWRWFAVLAVLLLVAACGEDGEPADPQAGEPAGEEGTPADTETGEPGGADATPTEPGETDAEATEAPTDQIDVTIAVGGAGAVVYLPTTLTQELGYYEEEGINANLQDFEGGSQALQAVIGGSADVVSGFYDHTIQLQPEGQELTAFVTILRYPGLVLAVSPTTDREIDGIEDLEGAIVGVTAPGSSTHLFINYLLSKEGMDPDDISVTGIGPAGTAVAAMERGEVDAAVMVDPAVSQVLNRNPDTLILADTRTPEGVQEVFGTESYPASVLYTRSDWIEENEETARRLARAMQRTLQWIQEHTPEEIAEQMPTEYRGDDPEIYIQAIENTMQMFSPDGVMQEGGPEAVLEVQSLSLEEVSEESVDLDLTYTNEFVEGD